MGKILRASCNIQDLVPNYTGKSAAGINDCRIITLSGNIFCAGRGEFVRSARSLVVSVHRR